jgi:YidC/Oxa1 family membrane protein insertase
MFWLIDWSLPLLGNFGVAILLTTVLVKAPVLPARQQVLRVDGEDEEGAAEDGRAPRALRRRQDEAAAGDDGALQEEKINPVAGCWPILIQIPVFFALYKVLFVTIEMRHAPFFGWIHDLSRRTRPTLFNLFGLLPFDPTARCSCMIGVWPIIMGITMWVQMKLNPTPPDPTQDDLHWMPLIFTFMLAGSRPAS